MRLLRWHCDWRGVDTGCATGISSTVVRYDECLVRVMVPGYPLLLCGIACGVGRGERWFCDDGRAFVGIAGAGFDDSAY